MCTDELAANASPARGISSDLQLTSKGNSGFPIDAPKVSYYWMEETTTYLPCRFYYDGRPGRVASNARKLIGADQGPEVLQDAPQLGGSTLDKAIAKIAERNQIRFHNSQIFNRRQNIHRIRGTVLISGKCLTVDVCCKEGN